MLSRPASTPPHQGGGKSKRKSFSVRVIQFSHIFNVHLKPHPKIYFEKQLYFSESFLYTRENGHPDFLQRHQMLTELPREVPDMEVLDLTILHEVADMAAGMSKEEILQTFSIVFDDLSKDEQVYFNEFFNYGRGMAVRKVVNNLIDSSKGRQGQAAAMSFLRRFAKEFEGELEGDASGEFHFQFGKVE